MYICMPIFTNEPHFSTKLRKSMPHSFVAPLLPFFPESIESQPSDDGSPSCEWALVGVIGSNQMRSEARKAELEKIKQRKTEHGMTIVNHRHPFSNQYFFLLPHSFLPSSPLFLVFLLLVCLPSSPSLPSLFFPSL